MEQIGKWNESDKQLSQLFATLISIVHIAQRYSANHRMLTVSQKPLNNRLHKAKKILLTERFLRLEAKNLYKKPLKSLRQFN